MNGFGNKRARRLGRLLALLGILVALLGLTGYWLSRDVQRTVLSPGERQLVNPGGDDFQVSFVLAGRDYDHDPAGPLVMRDGEWVRSFVTEARLGNRTDTIIYVNIVGNRVFMVAIPRDIVLNVPKDVEMNRRRIGINEVYDYPAYSGSPNRADNLRRAVSKLLDVPIDYYAVINIDIFERLVNDIGGVELEVPQRMDYVDQAGGLDIDLQPGFQRLNGKQAAGFVRFRQLTRGDIDRLDNIKTLAAAVLRRLQDLNVRAALAVPMLLDTYFDEVDTNLSPALASQLLPRLPTLRLESATLPTRDVKGSGRFVRTVPQEVETFLAGLFGGEARRIVSAPEEPIMLTNRSGLPGLARAVKAQLVELGIPAGRIATRQGGRDRLTRVTTTNAGLGAAPYYADLFSVGWQQVDRIPLAENIEIILGSDAQNFYFVKETTPQLAQGGTP